MDVFISYSSADRELIANIKRTLDDNNISGWVDYEERSIGSNYEGDIVRAIKDARVFLVFLSEASVKSAHVFRELSMANETGAAIIPIMIGDVKLTDDFSYYLRSINYIAYEQSEDFINKLLNEIGNKLKLEKNFDTSEFEAKPPVKKISKDKKKYIIIGAVALLLALAVGIAIGGGKDNDDKIPDAQPSESIKAEVPQDTAAQTQTTNAVVTEAPETDPPQTTEVGIEIPAEYAQAIEEFKYSALANHPSLNHTIAIGEKVTLFASWDNFYVVDSSIVSIEGKLVTGLAPGTTYIVEYSSISGKTGSVFKIVVTE